MLFLRDKFFLLNTLKNLIVFSIGTFLFLSIFDIAFNQEITWVNNLIQGVFLSSVMLGLLTFSDYKKITKFSDAGKNQKVWQRIYSRSGTLEITSNEILAFLKQYKLVEGINIGDNHSIHFNFQVNKYLPSLSCDITVLENTVTITFNNTAFFHFGAATSINLFIFLNDLQLDYESRKNKKGDK